MNPRIYPPVTDALRGTMTGLSQIKTISSEEQDQCFSAIVTLLSALLPIKEKIEHLDGICDDFQAFESLREMWVDLLVLNSWVQEAGEGYSEESEELLSERGTELLNMLTYIDECRNLEHRPEVKDFLSLYEEEADPEDLEYFMPLFECTESIAEGPEALASSIKSKITEDWEPEIIPIAFFLAKQGTPFETFKKMKSFLTEPEFQSAFFFALSTFYTGSGEKV